MQKNTINSNKYFLELFKNFSKKEIKALHQTLKKLADYDYKNQNPSEKQVAIDIGKNSEDMKEFLKQIREVFL
jgi:hypothetical protein